MFKSDEQKKLEKLAKKYQKSDKRLSWDTCMEKAKQASRHFNYS